MHTRFEREANKKQTGNGKPNRRQQEATGSRDATGSYGRPREATGHRRPQEEVTGGHGRPRELLHISYPGSPLGGPSLVRCCFLCRTWLLLFPAVCLWCPSGFASLLEATSSILLPVCSFSCTFLASRSMIAQVSIFVVKHLKTI